MHCCLLRLPWGGLNLAEYRENDMFFKGISLGSLLLIFLIVIILFGTKRLREIGNDLGTAVKNFRKGMQEEESKTENTERNS